jgi:L-lactate dehydrogenase complex protein LldG
MTDARTEILAAIHRAQHEHLQHAEIAEALSEIGAPPPVNLPSNDLVETFLRQLDSQQATAAIVKDRSTAVQAIADYVYERYHNRRVVAGLDRKLAALPWRDGSVLARFDASNPEDPVSVSYAKVGIAETGSLAVYCDRSNPGINNWLVQDHIILLDVEDLVADYEQAWQRLREVQVRDGSPRGISFISGPSSTSDIKIEKVFGAHGPARLHIVLIGNMVALQSATLEARAED